MRLMDTPIEAIEASAYTVPTESPNLTERYSGIRQLWCWSKPMPAVSWIARHLAQVIRMSMEHRERSTEQGAIDQKSEVRRSAEK